MQHQQPLNFPPLPLPHNYNGSHTPTPHHHHHHIHLHTHHQNQPPPLGPQQLPPSHSPQLREGGPDRKRPRSNAGEPNTVPSEDRNEWYYPAAPRPTVFAGDDEETLEPGTRTGNWGNKLVKGARWSRRGKVAAWGPRRAEWDMEERSRKRLKSILPASGSPACSPPLPTLPHLRSPSPPLTAPYPTPSSTHTSYTPYVLDASVQHSYRSKNILELERTGTELIEGEGALRIAIGALMREMDGDLVVADNFDYSRRGRSSVEREGSSRGGDTMEEDGSSAHESGIMPRSGDELLTRRRSNTHQLFISPHSIPVGPEGNITQLPPQSQIDSLEWCLNVLRDLADDGQEYHARLEEIRGGLGLSRAIRKEMWTITRQKALEEMEAEEGSGEGSDSE